MAIMQNYINLGGFTPISWTFANTLYRNPILPTKQEWNFVYISDNIFWENLQYLNYLLIESKIECLKNEVFSYLNIFL